ncbi:uncharacterized protein [Primulina huaijiensis]|uniref:uncharacterized protein n=1 Tax=Primulina huaijiensis TaxID=1492673 RepID=UPI003CC6F6EF
MAENREDARCNPPDAIPIRDHFRPVINTHYSGIARGTINANNFELKPALINMVQQNQFAGTATVDPHVHLRTFLEITDTVKINNVPDDNIRLRLFPFSLRGQSRGWLQSLPLGSITTWQELATKFLSKYFPPAKSAQLKIEISTFRQTDFEQLYEAWERYKELLRRCPNHGFEDWVQIELFYNGLNGQTRTTVDAAAGGTIFAKSPAQAHDLLDQMTINSYQWPSKRSGVKRTAGVYAVDPITSLTAHVSALTTQLAAMNKVSTAEGESAPVVVEESHFPEEVQYINNKNFGGYGGYQGNPPPNTYDPVLRNHENFSYANNKNVLNPPPGFNTSNGEGKPSFEDLVGTFVAESGKKMARTESRIDNLETHMANIGASLKILETQVGQITKQLTFQPSSSAPKATDLSMREVNAVSIQHEEVGMIEVEEKKVDHKPSWEDKPTPSKGNRGKKGKSYDFDQCINISLLPYPERFLQLKAKFQKKKGLENLKNLHSNIQSAEQEEVAFTGGNDKGRQGNLPQKLQDPEEFVVPCEIGGQLVDKAICDSGASVNIMPSSLYEKLGLIKIKPTKLSFQLADKSVKVPLGIVEDVELKIDKLRLPADFVVLDMENSQNVRIILGRPFLATAGGVIDLKQAKLTIEVEGQGVEIMALKGSHDPP